MHAAVDASLMLFLISAAASRKSYMGNYLRCLLPGVVYLRRMFLTAACGEGGRLFTLAYVFHFAC